MALWILALLAASAFCRANDYWSKPLTPFRNHTRDREERPSLVISLTRRMLARRSDGSARTDYPQEPGSL
jgi:hypothetical protein